VYKKRKLDYVIYVTAIIPMVSSIFTYVDGFAFLSKYRGEFDSGCLKFMSEEAARHLLWGVKISIIRYSTMISALTGIFICALGNLSKAISGIKLEKRDAVEFFITSGIFLVVGYFLPYIIFLLIRMLAFFFPNAANYY